MNFPLIPEQASTFAEDVDSIFWALTGLTIFFSALVLGIMLFFAVKYRRGAKVKRDASIHGDLRFELAWSIVPLILGCMVFAWSAKPYSTIWRPPANSMEIFVIGKRWMWHLQHANGIRENNELHIPVGKPVKLTMISQDVIHGFYVPAFRAKRDVLPGRYNTFWFQATKTGKFHLFCTEYCGTNHSEMGGWVYVMTPHDFELWKSSGGNSAVAEHETLEQQGSNLYQTMACANCHQPQDNVHGPSLYGLFMSKVKLTSGETVVADDNYIRESIVNPHAKIVAGYQDIMQGYPVGEGQGYLSEEQIMSLVAYVKTLGVAQSAGGAPISNGSSTAAASGGRKPKSASSPRNPAGAMNFQDGSTTAGQPVTHVNLPAPVANNAAQSTPLRPSITTQRISLEPTSSVPKYRPQN